MRRTGVTSGVILSVGYEAAIATLEVELAPGEVFQYFNVPLSTYIALMNAGPKGDFYNHNIKAIYESKKMTEDVIMPTDNRSNLPLK